MSFKLGTLVLIIATVLGYFVYGNTVAGALGVFLYAIAIGLISILGAIPVIGVFIVYILASWIGPIILAYTGIVATTLTSFVFWYNLFVAGIFTLAMTIGLWKAAFGKSNLGKLE